MITPISPISHIQLLCAFLEALIIPTNIPPDSPREVYEVYFVFACIWAYGSALFHDGQTDYKSEFSKYFLNQFQFVKFPKAATVFDVWVDRDTQEFAHWSDMVPSFELEPDIPLQACLVHTAETIRIKYFLDLLVKLKFPTMLVGMAGSGKSLLINEKLLHMGEDYVVANIPFNYYYK